MTQTTTLSLTASNQDPNGVGVAPGFDLSLPSDLDFDQMISASASLFGITASDSLALNIGLTGSLAATQGYYNISYPIDVNAQFATAVSDGENISIDTSSYSVNNAMVTLTGPGTTANLTINDSLDGGINYGPFSAGIDVNFDQTYALTQSPSIDSAYGSLAFAFPTAFTQASTASSGTNFLPYISVSGADSPVVTASINLANIAAAIAGEEVPLSGTLAAFGGTVGYNFAAAPVTGEFSIGQTFSFNPTEVLVSMSDGTQTETGLLGSTFNFLAPSTGTGTLAITATYTLEGTISDLYGIVGTFNAALNALSATAGPVTFGPAFSQAVTTGPIDLATGYPVTTQNVTVASGTDTYNISYGPNAGQDQSGGALATAAGTVSSGQTNTTYTATADLAASIMNFTSQRVGELEPEELAVLVTFASSNPDPGGIGLSINQSGTSLPVFNIAQNVTGLNQNNTLGTLMVAESADTAGSYNGEITLAVSYDDGAPTPETIAASETIYNIAGALVGQGTQDLGFINLGTFRVGDTPTLSVTITNTGSAGPYTDTLVSGANEEGIFTLDNTVALAGGANGTIGVSIDTSTDGSFSADADIFGLLSHDASLPDEGIDGGADLTAEIYQTASVGFVFDSESGGIFADDEAPLDTLSQTGADNWVFDFGTINIAGDNLDTLNIPYLSIENTATATLSDMLSGTVTEFGDTDGYIEYGQIGYVGYEGTFTALAAGDSDLFAVLAPDNNTPGTYDETYIVTPDSVDGGGTLALAPVTLTIEATIADTAPQIAPIVTASALSAVSAVSTGVLVTGTLTHYGQDDWVAVSLVAGQAYEIAVNGLSTGAQISVVQAGATDGATGIFSDDVLGNAVASENYAYIDAASTGLYYVDISDVGAALPETYEVSAAPVVADYADNASTRGTVGVGGSLTGTLSNIGQDDWIAVSLGADQGYEISVTGLESPFQIDTAADTVSPTGIEAGSAEYYNAESQAGGTFDAYFMPSIAGTYYLDVFDAAATAGFTPYTVAVAAVTPFVADNASTEGSLAVGHSLIGTLANIDEEDWIAVSLAANQAYEVTVNGLPGEAQIFVGDAAGLPVDDEGNPTSLIGLNSFAQTSEAYFMPSTSGTFYISLQDQTAAAGTTYSVSLAAVSADYTDNPSAPGQVTVGGAVTGTLTNIGQNDWIAVSLTADQAYEITTNGLSQYAQVQVENGAAEGDNSGIGEATTGLYGATVTANDAYFMPTASGVYDIDVSDYAATTATPYTLSVAAVSADYTDNASAPGHVAVGGTTTGTLANIGQDDWVAATLTANQAYEFTVAGLSGDAQVSVQNGQATNSASSIPPSETAAPGGAGLSDTYFMPAASGVYYLDIIDPGAITPETYTVSLAAVSADYADNPTTTGLVIPDEGEQIAAPGAAIRPFAGLNIAESSGQTLALTITSSNPANGSFSNLSGGTYDAAAGTYNLFGSPAVVSAALDALTFTPVVGQATTTNFQISVLDVDGVYAADGAVSVVTGQTIAAGTGLTLYGAQSLPAGYMNDGTLGLVDATLTADGAFTNNGQVDVDPSNVTFTGAVTGTGTIDIAAGSDVTFDGSVASTQTIVFQGTAGTLTLNDPLHFEAAVFGSGVTVMAPPCFAAGTRIRTALGTQARVEDLREGDEVETYGGKVARINWIGRRSLAPRRHPRPEAVQPILITAGALGDGLPWRDLVVSPDHAMYLEGHLVPAKALINGFSIRQLNRKTVTYYHIALPEHAVLLAEGAGAESYLETGNRAAFENGGGTLTMHPDFAQSLREERGCAPFAESGKAVETIRQRILDRAGIETTSDPDLQIRYKNGQANIVSRSAIPGEIFADPRDRRRLGVKISALKIGRRKIPIDDPALTDGWHDIEADGRWTNGNAIIPPGLLGKAKSIRLTIAASLAYPVLEGPGKHKHVQQP